jgi:hypothetical protein
MPCFPVVGDLELNDDETDFVTAAGTAALAQRIRIGLLTPLGYWRWDTTVGVPILGVEKLSVSVLKAFMRRFLLSFDEVVRVVRLEVAADTAGRASVNYEILTRASETVQDSVPFQVVNQ